MVRTKPKWPQHHQIHKSPLSSQMKPLSAEAPKFLDEHSRERPRAQTLAQNSQWHSPSQLGLVTKLVELNIPNSCIEVSGPPRFWTWSRATTKRISIIAHQHISRATTTGNQHRPQQQTTTPPPQQQPSTTNNKCTVTRTATATATTATTVAARNTKQHSDNCSIKLRPTTHFLPRACVRLRTNRSHMASNTWTLRRSVRRLGVRNPRLLVQNRKKHSHHAKTAVVHIQHQQGQRQETVRPATPAAASTLGATWTTTTRTAAKTTSFPPVLQYRHVARRRNSQHDRDNSNLANNKAPTKARTAPATSLQTQ